MPAPTPPAPSANPAVKAEAAKEVNFGIDFNPKPGPHGGVVIARTHKFGSAAKAGLLANDEMIALNGDRAAIGSPAAFIAKLSSVGVGGTITVNIYRGDKRIDVPTKLLELKRLNLELDEFDSVLERKIAP